jgi:hypothetical protein
MVSPFNEENMQNDYLDFVRSTAEKEIDRLRKENAKLRAVVEAAKSIMRLSADGVFDAHGTMLARWSLQSALAALESSGNSGELKEADHE